MGMTPKELLLSIRERDEEIERLMRELDELRMRAYSVGAVDYARVRVHSSDVGDRTAIFVERIDKLERCIDRKVDELAERKEQALYMLSGLTEEEEIVLHARYFRGLSFRQIAAEIGWNKDRVFRMHRKALASLGPFEPDDFSRSA